MVLKVYTRYKEEPPRAEDKPKVEMSMNDWIQSMAEAGFDGEFFAVANDGRQYKGELVKKDGKIVVKSRRVPTQEELKEKMNALKKVDR